jgi:hypothetical protein
MIGDKTEWSKTEKEIARKAFRAAYHRECSDILTTVRKMASEAEDPASLWQIHDFLSKKRKESDEKYDYRYSVLPLVFARLMYEGRLKPEDLEGISEDKLQGIRQFAEFYARS